MKLFTKYFFFLILIFNAEYAHTASPKIMIKCRYGSYTECAQALTEFGVSASGFGLSSEVCSSNTKSAKCRAAMIADATAILANAAGAGMIVGGAAAGVAVTHFAGKIASCDYSCTQKLASETALPFQELLQNNPATTLPNINKIVTQKNNGNFIYEKPLRDTVWCLTYCPAKYNQRFMCRLLEKMDNQTHENKESIKHYAYLLASTGTTAGIQKFLGLDQLADSKFSVFVKRNGDEPSFCAYYQDKNSIKNNLFENYTIVRNVYNQFKDILTDPYLKCSLHKTMYDNHMDSNADKLPLTHSINGFLQSPNIALYQQLKEQDDPGLKRILKSRSLFESEGSFCKRTTEYLEKRMPKTSDTTNDFDVSVSKALTQKEKKRWLPHFFSKRKPLSGSKKIDPEYNDDDDNDAPLKPGSDSINTVTTYDDDDDDDVRTVSTTTSDDDDDNDDKPQRVSKNPHQKERAYFRMPSLKIPRFFSKRQETSTQ